MIGLYSKFHRSWLIRSWFDKALFRVEEVQEKERRRINMNFKAHLASRARAS